MKIRLLKPWKNPAGREIPKGREFTVTNELGREMVKQKIAEEADRKLLTRLGLKKKKKGAEENEDKGE